MSEQQTRKEIIDKRLLKAGWLVGNPLSVQIEHQVFDQFGHKEGVGYCDYVLLGNDLRPIAVVKAKKSSAKLKEEDVNKQSKKLGELAA